MGSVNGRKPAGVGGAGTSFALGQFALKGLFFFFSIITDTEKNHTPSYTHRSAYLSVSKAQVTVEHHISPPSAGAFLVRRPRAMNREKATVREYYVCGVYTVCAWAWTGRVSK